MSQNDMHLLFQQMGEVLSGIRGLHDTIDIRQAQAEQLHEIVRSDLATMRRDHRDLQEKFDCAFMIVQHDIENLRSGSSNNVRTIETVALSVEAMRTPVAEIVGFKARMTGLLLALSILGSCGLWLAGPLYSFLVGSVFERHP